MRNPKSTPLQRLNDAADRIRREYVIAYQSADLRALKLSHEKARALGLTIRHANGEVTVSRLHREEENGRPG